MKIGIFTDSFIPEVNGVVTSLQLFIAEFRRRAHEVFLFYPNNGLHLKNNPSDRTYCFPSILIWGKQFRFAFPFLRSKKIAFLNLDIIHNHTPGSIGWAGLHLAKKFKIPAVYTYHTRVERYAQFYLHLPAWLENATFTAVSKGFYNRHNLIIAPSKGIKKELEQYVKKPIEVIPTGIDIKANLEKASRINPQEILAKYNLKITNDLLITASRIGKEKNIGFLFEAFCKIKKNCPNAKLLVAGGGPEKEAFVKYAASLDCGRDIIFLGFLKQEELFSLYQVAKVFLFSSFTETQGLVVLEAMAMGLPVVALEAVGVEDLMENNQGGFMTENNNYIFSQKVVALINDFNLWQEKKESALKQAQNFSIEKMGDKLIEVYERLIKNNF